MTSPSFLELSVGKLLSPRLINATIKKNKPSVIICDTVRGKGLPSIEKKADRWFVNFSKSEIKNLIKELHGEGEANLTSEKLTVR